jgi:defect in organelle trafficking protein DotD
MSSDSIRNGKCVVMKKLISSLVFTTTALFFSGCATHAKTSPDLGSVSQNTQTKLSEAAVSATHSLHNLAMIEQAEHPSAMPAIPPDPETYGMGQQASIDWYGPIEPLVKRIATATQYKLRVIGVQPAIPIIVSITATDTPLGDILRDAAYQAHDKGTVIVFPSTRTIELRYAKN